MQQEVHIVGTRDLNAGDNTIRVRYTGPLECYLNTSLSSVFGSKLSQHPDTVSIHNTFIEAPVYYVIREWSLTRQAEILKSVLKIRFFNTHVVVVPWSILVACSCQATDFQLEVI